LQAEQPGFLKNPVVGRLKNFWSATDHLCKEVKEFTIFFEKHKKFTIFLAFSV
jgi:hypothetical protein